MTYHRLYRPALGLREALWEITTGQGVFYDKAAVGACVQLFRERRFVFELLRIKTSLSPRAPR